MGKPKLSITKRLARARKELTAEGLDAAGTVQTTIVLEADLTFAVKTILLERRKRGIRPHTFTGLIREALKNFIANEK